MAGTRMVDSAHLVLSLRNAHFISWANAFFFQFAASRPWDDYTGDTVDILDLFLIVN